MAQYIARIKGQRGETTRLGTKTSGIEASINGWNIGVDVDIYFNTDKETDQINVYLTGGSNNKRTHKFIGIFDKEDLKNG